MTVLKALISHPRHVAEAPPSSRDELGSAEVGATCGANGRQPPARRYRGAPRMPGSQWPRSILLALLSFSAACGSSLRSQGPVVTPTPMVPVHVAAASAPVIPAPQAIPSEDPVHALIATSDRLFKAGQ